MHGNTSVFSAELGEGVGWLAGLAEVSAGVVMEESLVWVV